MSCSSPRPAGELAVKAQLVGHHLREPGNFHRVHQDVLPVAGAELESAEQFDELRVQPGDAGFHQGVLAGGGDLLVDLLLAAGDDLLDPRRVDSPVGDEFLQRTSGDLAADGIEGRADDHAGRVVDDDVDAGGLLERADVPPLAADDTALHVVGGDVDRADGVFGGVVGGVPLDGLEDQLAGLGFDGVAGLGEFLLDDAGDVGVGVLGGHVEDLLAGLVGGHVGDLHQLGLLLGDEVVEVAVLGDEGLFLLVQGPLAGLEVAFLGGEGLHLLVDRVLALREAFLLAAEFLAGFLGLLVELLAELDELALGGGFGLGADLACVGFGGGADRGDFGVEGLSADAGVVEAEGGDGGGADDGAGDADEGGDSGGEVGKHARQRHEDSFRGVCAKRDRQADATRGIDGIGPAGIRGPVRPVRS